MKYNALIYIVCILLHIVNYVKSGRYKGGVPTPLIRGIDSHSQLCERRYFQWFKILNDLGKN